MDISWLVKRFQDAGVDALRVGMGISSVSTAHKDRGCGRAQASAVYNVVSWLRLSFCRSYPLIISYPKSGGYNP